MQTAFRRTFRAWPLLLALLLVAGCKSLPSKKKSKLSSEDLVRVERVEALRKELAQFAEYADSAIRGAADSIAEATDDREIHRAVLLWKLNALANVQTDLIAKSPPELLLDWWAFWLRVSLYLSEGQGRTLFGDQQRTALRATTEILQRVETLAREYVPAGQFSETSKQIMAYAKENPISGVFAVEAAKEFAETQGGQRLLTGALSAPFRAVGEGLDPTSSLATSVDQFTELMQDYPSMVRWQALLLLLEIERSAAVESTVKSAEDISKAATQLAAVAEELPQEVRKELKLLLDDLEEQHPELRATLNEARQTVDGINQALVRAETVNASLESALKEFSSAGKTWTTTADAVTRTIEQIQQFGGGDKDPEPPPSEKATEESKFDIKDYTATADALTVTSKELRALLTEARDFAESDALSRTTAQASAATGEVLDLTDTRLRGLIDYAFYRALIFVFLVLLGLIVYRVVGKKAVGRWAP